MIGFTVVPAGKLPSVEQMQRVLLLGPDDSERRALHLMLDRAGARVAALTEVASVGRYLADHACEAVIAPAEVAAAFVEGGGARPWVVAVTRSRDLAGAAALLDAGVDDVIAAPVDELAVSLALRRAAGAGRARAGDVAAPGPPAGDEDAPALIGDSAEMQRLRELIRQVGPTRSTALIAGESGTGKELVARALHAASPRRARRFVAVNCAAIPATLLEPELFGHVKGAFTDAVRDRAGLFEEAAGGTLLLDEVGELPLALQAKLLRVLEDGEVRRVGDPSAIQIDVRVIAATLRDLDEEVAAGRFRADLYHRLHVVPIRLPPLRERPEDIPQLARFFVRRHAVRHGRGEVALSDAAIRALAAQPWPGNVRELENAIERAIVLAEGPTIDLAFLATVVKLEAPAAGDGAEPALSMKRAIQELEQRLIRRALGETQGNRAHAARLLGISDRALFYKMREYGI